MCLAVVAWQTHPDYPLVVAANRDEYYARATRGASWWGQNVSLLAGRAEDAGGTWFGINRQGRFALLTNVRAAGERNPHAPSRGGLVVAALQATMPIGRWLHEFAPRSGVFNGFNLLVGDPLASGAQAAGLYYFSNRRDLDASALAPGIYGLSNAALDTPWPKLTRTVARFALQIAQRVSYESLMAMMADRSVAPDWALPPTGVPLDWERALSAVQIRANGYGTRATTVLTVRTDGLATFVERSFDSAEPQQYVDRLFEFTLGANRRSAPTYRVRGGRGSR
jgi:uncharacterized protein with NRDE domain